MNRSIVLAFDVAASPARVYDILTTTEGQSAFWTGDCDVQAGRAQFRFPGEPPIEADITTQPGQLVRMHATSGITHGGTVTWEYELHPAGAQTTVLFREQGFGSDYSEIDLGRTSQTWARIMDRLVSYVATGTPQPYFPATAAPDRVEREILIERPPTVVWRALTEPSQLGRWFTDAAAIDMRPGGDGTLTFTGRATNAPATVRILVESLEQPRLFSFRWDHPAGARASDGNSLLVEFHLTPEGENTRLRVAESGFTALQRPEDEKAEYAEVHGKGWDTHLASLHSYLSGQSQASGWPGEPSGPPAAASLAPSAHPHPRSRHSEAW